MLNFSKKKKKDNITVLKSTRPNECGGTDAIRDESAPKEIISKDMILFNAFSALNFLSRDEEKNDIPFWNIGFIAAFAAKCEPGSFVFLQTREYRGDPTENCDFALIKADIFPGLDALVRKYEFAAQNGYYSTTHGLPENFGGEVHISYAGGEQINFSDNQSPVISRKAAVEAAQLFADCLKRERLELPDLSGLKEIRFSSVGSGKTEKATLTLLPDGTGINKKVSDYREGNIYESEKQVDADTVKKIKSTVQESGMLFWRFLPASDYTSNEKKQLTFVFEDGEITAPGDRKLPQNFSGGFFNIELEMTVKH